MNNQLVTPTKALNIFKSGLASSLQYELLAFLPLRSLFAHGPLHFVKTIALYLVKFFVL